MVNFLLNEKIDLHLMEYDKMLIKRAVKVGISWFHKKLQKLWMKWCHWWQLLFINERKCCMGGIKTSAGPPQRGSLMQDDRVDTPIHESPNLHPWCGCILPGRHYSHTFVYACDHRASKLTKVSIVNVHNTITLNDDQCISACIIKTYLYINRRLCHFICHWLLDNN